MRVSYNLHTTSEIKLTYHSSFLNAVQVFQQWQDYFGHPEGSQLGLLVALYQIGSVVSIPLA